VSVWRPPFSKDFNQDGPFERESDLHTYARFQNHPLMERTAATMAIVGCLLLLAMARVISRARRRRKPRLGEVSQQWLSQHVNDLQE
jgi:hypothetical protein